MKQIRIYSTLVILLTAINSFAQPAQEKDSVVPEDKALSVEISLARTNMLARIFPGMSGHYIYFYSARFGTGVSLASYQTQIIQTFGYPVVNPQLLYSQYGWINQFNLINNKYIKFKLNFTNGLIQMRLIDDTRRYYTGPILMQPNLNSSFYYFIQPGADLSFRLFGPLYITTGVNYRFLFGGDRLGDRKQFQNYAFSLGITVISIK